MSRKNKGSGQSQHDSDGEEPIPVIVVGRGELGSIVASSLQAHPELQLLGVVDGGGGLTKAASGARGGVAVICKGSTLEEIEADAMTAIAAGLHVVSPCEELVNPSFVDPDLADRLDRAATARGVCVLGVGVNPGFVLDRLVVTLGSAVGAIRRVEASRRIALGANPPSRMGIGLTEGAFERGIEDGRVGHVGLSESCHLVAEGLGLPVDEVEESIDPILAQGDLVEGSTRIEKGRVLGFRQEAAGFDEGREVIRLTMEVSVGLEDPRDWIRIEGEPPVEMRIPGGIPDERSLGAIVANAVLAVTGSAPGLMTVLDLPAGL